jgi:adenylate cyclase
VIGDAVNLASRVEALTKTHKVPILVTDATRDVAETAFLWDEMVAVAVRGKLEPVRTWLPKPLAAPGGRATTTR